MFGPKKVASPSNSRAFSPPRDLDGRIACLSRKADRSGPSAHPGFRSVRHQPADVIVWRPLDIELVDLVLGEISDCKFLRAGDMACEWRQPVGE